MIPFNRPSVTALERRYVAEALSAGNLSGDGPFTRKAVRLLRRVTGIASPMLLTTSCTHALEMSARLLKLQPGDEVILPSYTFVSTANAVLQCGAVPVFADIDPRTMNLDASKLEELITGRTRAVYVVHYAGVPCEMDTVMDIARRHALPVVEDAAQAVGSHYKNRSAGSIGDYGCFSFHETKNYTMGEGGALILNRSESLREAEIIREKGTDRSRFVRGEVDKYTWQQPGSSYLPSDVLAATLCGQLERFDEIMESRMRVWNAYHEGFQQLEKAGKARRPFIPDDVGHNAHLYYLLLENRKVRDRLIEDLRRRGVQACFHYVALHTSPQGLSLGCRPGTLPVTEDCAERLLRLPLYCGMREKETAQVIQSVTECL
ncbi:dTDP-4-amino-4,6-dideoxygalactose transaminase [Candidatus Soleaferrea massiliensis]|uniref:dTDP-4-amino-4,6-dideoxygalactose transaminase n=1 Tax=Candidatus Soleaferrea massiliensis TaxID=1470354 RepID=UPI00058BFA32|nr:dTDP-4-amino-4,6-dideoxygalactose transaminase [Candidatus Soleaferrea massiliensis]